MNESSSNVADTLVIFGITGDLARKMTFQALYQLELARQLNCPIVGVAVEDWSVDHLRSSALAALESDGGTASQLLAAGGVHALASLEDEFPGLRAEAQ